MSEHGKQHTLGNAADHSSASDWTSLQTTFTANSASWSSSNNFPQRATMWHHEATAVTGNPIVIRNAAHAYYHASYRFAGPADGTIFTQSFFLAAGTYDFYILGITYFNRGKIDWSVDGVSIETGQDWYTPGAGYNVVKTISSVTITGDGYHKLTGTVNGKHTSATDYYIVLTKYWFKKSSDAARS